MSTLDLSMYLLVIAGSGLISILMLRTLGQSAVAVAFNEVAARREREASRQAENAAAEAAGRAAALEPLALNPDGTVEEPIIGIVESR